MSKPKCPWSWVQKLEKQLDKLNTAKTRDFISDLAIAFLVSDHDDVVDFLIAFFLLVIWHALEHRHQS